MNEVCDSHMDPGMLNVLPVNIRLPMVIKEWSRKGVRMRYHLSTCPCDTSISSLTGSDEQGLRIKLLWIETSLKLCCSGAMFKGLQIPAEAVQRAAEIFWKSIYFMPEKQIFWKILLQDVSLEEILTSLLFAMLRSVSWKHKTFTLEK